jgi:hypothetical protein
VVCPVREPATGNSRGPLPGKLRDDAEVSSWDDVPPWERPEEPDADPSTAAGLVELLDAQAALLVDVATGGSPIDNVNGTYKRRREILPMHCDLNVPVTSASAWVCRAE